MIKLNYQAIKRLEFVSLCNRWHESKDADLSGYGFLISGAVEAIEMGIMPSEEVSDIIADYLLKHPKLIDFTFKIYADMSIKGLL